MPDKLSKIELPNGNTYTIVDRTLAAGENITITENATTGVRTIASTGGGGASASVSGTTLYILTSIQSGDSSEY